MNYMHLLLPVGMLVLLVGAVMSIMDLAPYADYALISGAILVIFSGAIRAHERSQNRDENAE